MLKRLEIKNLNINIDEEDLIKNLNIEIYENEVVGILGESGSGKTLTSKFILNILPEKSIIKYDKFEKKAKIGAIFQNAFILLNPTVKIGKQLLHLYKSNYNTTENFEEEVDKLFKKVALDKSKYMNKYPFETSGGERQRIAIVGTLLSKPDILIADEITTALDSDSKKEVIDLLKKIKEKSSIVFISHEVNTMRDFVDRIYVMYKGEIIEQNTAYEIFNHPKHNYTKKLIEIADKYRR